MRPTVAIVDVGRFVLVIFNTTPRESTVVYFIVYTVNVIVLLQIVKGYKACSVNCRRKKGLGTVTFAVT